MTYRPEIDGLRALAVTLVVLFHLSIAPFTGGFIGVDVFFVISGFLITRLLWSEGADLSLGRFYLRRARRLLPALFVTVVLTSLVAWLVFDRADLIAMLRSALLALASLSNVGFWLEAGYWDIDSTLKPLLHTWSLGVEEQFYLIWPLIVLAGLALKASRTVMLGVMALVAVAGVFVAEWALDHYEAAAFYLMPFRVTEFALGALIAFLPAGLMARLPGLVRQLMFAAGLIAIGAAALVYDEATRFPGLASWLPCLGAVLVIGAGRVPVLGALLANPVSVFVGKMSYSLYLVHWPLIVFFNYQFGSEPDVVQIAWLLGVMATLAYGLYRFVEMPLRAPSGTAAQIGGAGWVMGTGWAASLGIAVALLVQLQSVPEQAPTTAAQTVARVHPGLVPPDVVALLDRTDVNDRRYDAVRAQCPEIEDTDCLSIREARLNILILGDSQGVDGFNAVRAAMPNAHVIPGSFRGCAPVYDIVGYQSQVRPYNREALIQSCREWNTQLFADEGIIKDVDIIVVSTFWRPVRIEFFEGTIERIRALNPNARVLLLGNGTILNRRFVDIARETQVQPGSSIAEVDIYPMTFSLDEAVADLAARHEGVVWTSRNAFFCPGGECAVFTPAGADFVTYDRVHSSLAASQEFGQAVLRPWLQRLSLNTGTE